MTKLHKYLKADEMIPAVGQGALAIECRADDTEMLDMLDPINDEATRYAVEGERGFASIKWWLPSANGRTWHHQ